MARDRNVIPIAVDRKAKEVIEAIADELGMKEIGVASRVYKWFADQDPVIQRGVLGLLPPTYEKEIIRLALERLAADTAKPAKGK